MQVFADVKPVTLAYPPEEKVGFLVRKRHENFLRNVRLHYDKKVSNLMLLPLDSSAGHLSEVLS